MRLRQFLVILHGTLVGEGVRWKVLVKIALRSPAGCWSPAAMNARSSPLRSAGC